MLTTDLPDGAWQRQALPAVVTELTVTDPPLAAFIQLVAPTPEQMTKLLERSYDFMVNGLLSEQHAVTSAFREFYQAVNGEALVAAHAPQTLPQPETASEDQDATNAPQTGAQTPRRGRPPRLDPTLIAPPQVTGTIDPDLLDGHDDVVATIDASAAGEALVAEMQRFAAELAALTDFFADLQIGDTRVRTFSSAEAAALLGVSPATMKNWRDRGFGPDFIVTGTRGDAVRYPVFRIVQWLVTASERAS